MSPAYRGVVEQSHAKMRAYDNSDRPGSGPLGDPMRNPVMDASYGILVFPLVEAQRDGCVDEGLVDADHVPSCVGLVEAREIGRAVAEGKAGEVKEVRGTF